MSRYASTLIFSVMFPFVLSFWPPLKFWRNKKAIFISMLYVTVIFGAWDVLATWRGHWSFNPNGVFGITFINLPIEEWLFFPVITFCCIFTWETLNYLKRKFQ